ncbi:FUN14 family-domain-containing protein [Gloeopeniophorella convolvens]|nr:FUN14 family-domain-containing protein [Gloeopeniophorella convolvens]
MASLYTHIFSRQAASCRTVFHRGFVQANRSALRPPFPTLWAASPRSLHHAAARRMPATLAWATAGVAGMGLGLSLCANLQTLNCEPSPQSPPKGARGLPSDADLPAPPKSSVNFYELSFGTVCGICAGVFVKKGAKALAFLFGGVFVLLQYLGSASIVKVDWAKAGTRFENLFYTQEANGVRRPSTVSSLWRWLVDFLTADFQPRASFIAGFALGLRIG